LRFQRQIFILPTANSQQPTANSQQPTANSQQPIPKSLTLFIRLPNIISAYIIVFLYPTKNMKL